MHTVGRYCLHHETPPIEQPRPLRRGDGVVVVVLLCCVCVPLQLSLFSPPVCDLVGSSIWRGVVVGKEPDQAERAWCHHRRPKPPILTNQQQECGSPAMPPGRPSNRGMMTMFEQNVEGRGEGESVPLRFIPCFA